MVNIVIAKNPTTNVAINQPHNVTVLIAVTLHKFRIKNTNSVIAEIPAKPPKKTPSLIGNFNGSTERDTIES